MVVAEKTENKPSFSNASRVLGRYWNDIEPNLKAYMKEALGYTPSFTDVDVEIAKLPTYVDEGNRLVGKVHGMYDPETQKMYLDPALFKEFDDPEREVLKKYDLEGKPEEIMVHELVHHVQRNLGSLNTHPRGYIEGVATKVTEDITRKRQRTYPKETKEIEDLSKYFTPEELLKGARKLNLN